MSGRVALRALGGVLIGLAALLVVRAVVFVPEASACLPGFKPKPGVTNPTDNARDCEPASPAPPGGTAAPPGSWRPSSPSIPDPRTQRKKVEDLLKRQPGGEGAGEQPRPTAPPPGKDDDTDEAIKRLGKKLEEGFVCGPDITAVLKLMVAEIESVWHNLPETIWDEDLGKNIDPRGAACSSIAPGHVEVKVVPGIGLVPVPAVNPRAINAWDCQEMKDPLPFRRLFPQCSKGKGCVQTVTVDKKCHYTGSVNYVIFGVLWRECSKRPGSVRGGTVGLWSAIYAYKTYTEASNAAASYAWAEATYNGWPHKPGVLSPPGESDVAHCATTCPGTYLNPLHWWVQGLQEVGTWRRTGRPRNLNGYDGNGYRDNMPTPKD